MTKPENIRLIAYLLCIAYKLLKSIHIFQLKKLDFVEVEITAIRLSRLLVI